MDSEAETMPMMGHDVVNSRKRKRTRTRSGCLNCRRKRKKCDETRPSCMKCAKRGEKCENEAGVVFKTTTATPIARTIVDPSARVLVNSTCPARPPIIPTPKRFDIIDVTTEVVHDYHTPLSPTVQKDNTSRSNDASHRRGRISIDSDGAIDPAFSHQHDPLNPIEAVSTSPTLDNIVGESFLCLRNGQPPNFQPQPLTTNIQSAQRPASPESPVLPNLSATGISPESSGDDGIFLPGSTYHELHSTLRDRLFAAGRCVTPPPNSQSPPFSSPQRRLRSADATNQSSDASLGSLATERLSNTLASIQTVEQLDDTLNSEYSLRLTQEEEYKLWKNWTDEIAPWLDKFDNARHFQYTLPAIARSHEYLRYAMLALSARQIEQKACTRRTELSLCLYQQAIHSLLPILHSRSSPVIASCVVLCVLEMLSCSPKAWRRHLDGCANLMGAAGINGFVGGLEQALFWCFARMDVCGGLISSDRTLVPVRNWASGITVKTDVAMFETSSSFDMHANLAVYLCAQVLALLASYNGPKELADLRERDYATRWTELWSCLTHWQDQRPTEFYPLTTIRRIPSSSSDSNPFPIVFFSNPAAISGTQLYHTASIKLLQNKPPGLKLNCRARSTLWHARQICAISLSNDHHGAWTNSIQPLWIAGQYMSHPSEHDAIIGLLRRIERESGWSTKWKIDDLKEFWGDSDN